MTPKAHENGVLAHADPPEPPPPPAEDPTGGPAAMIAEPPGTATATDTNTPTAKPGRDARGWFVKGNTISRGHPSPHASKVAALRATWFREATPENMARIIRSMLVEAAGVWDHAERKWLVRPNVRAAELVLAYTIGKPVEIGAEERLRRIEQALGLAHDLDPEHLVDLLDVARREGDRGEEEP